MRKKEQKEFPGQLVAKIEVGFCELVAGWAAENECDEADIWREILARQVARLPDSFKIHPVPARPLKLEGCINVRVRRPMQEAVEAFAKQDSRTISFVV